MPVNVHKNRLIECYKDTVFTPLSIYEGWNFNSGNYLFTTDTK